MMKIKTAQINKGKYIYRIQSNCFAENLFCLLIAFHARKKNPITIERRHAVPYLVCPLLKMKEKLKVNILKAFRRFASPGRITSYAIDFSAQPFYLEVQSLLFGEFKGFCIGFFRHLKTFFVKKLTPEFFVLLDYLPCLESIPLVLD